jgi:mono/diheme cytochrome c family protein
VIAQETPPPAEPAPPGDSDIPSIEAGRKNPVEPDEGSLGRGKTMYTDRCVMCHGKTGNGKGSLALQIGYKVPDFTRADALAHLTDGALYYRITRGHEAMPGEQDFITDKEKWDLVNYLRTFPPKG